MNEMIKTWFLGARRYIPVLLGVAAAFGVYVWGLLHYATVTICIACTIAVFYFFAWGPYQYGQFRKRIAKLEAPTGDAPRKDES
jgi:hypothetical protein